MVNMNYQIFFSLIINHELIPLFQIGENSALTVECGSKKGKNDKKKTPEEDKATKRGSPRRSQLGARVFLLVCFSPD